MCETENNLQKRIDLLVKENNRLYQKVKTANRKNQRLRGFLKRHNIEFNIEEKCFKTRNLIIDDDEIENDNENNNKNKVSEKTEITEVTVVSEGSDNASENGSVEDGNISDNWEDTSALYE